MIGESLQNLQHPILLAGHMRMAVDLYAGGFFIMLKAQNQGNGFILNKGEHRHSYIKEEEQFFTPMNLL